MMKIKLINIFLLLVPLIFISCNDTSDDIGFGGYTHPEFKTNLTVEEHIYNITQIASAKYEKNIESGGVNSFTVEIVYAFDGNPEYFLIEFDKLGVVPYAHLIGYIENDCYMTGIICYDAIPRIGESYYKAYGITTEKKYYGATVFAAEIDGKIIGIPGHKDSSNSNKYVDKEIPETDFEYLVRANFKLFPRKYS